MDNDLEKFTFYHPGVSITEAASLLQAAPSGTYLLTGATIPRIVCTLNVRGDRDIAHIPIQHDADHGYFMAAPSESRRYFARVTDLIDYCTGTGKRMKAVDADGKAIGESRSLFALKFPLNRTRTPFDMWL